MRCSVYVEVQCRTAAVHTKTVAHIGANVLCSCLGCGKHCGSSQANRVPVAVGTLCCPFWGLACIVLDPSAAVCAAGMSCTACCVGELHQHRPEYVVRGVLVTFVGVCGRRMFRATQSRLARLLCAGACPFVLIRHEVRLPAVSVLSLCLDVGCWSC